MSFVATILQRAHAAATRPVLYEVHGNALAVESGGALLSKVACVRGFLRVAGVRPGDRVALLGPNSAAWVATDLAIVAEGAICVPLYARQEPVQIAGMLRDCAPKLLIAADATLAGAIERAWPEHARIAQYDEVLAAPPVSDAQLPSRGGGPVTIIYTSGTSGEPKGVVLDGDNVDHVLAATV